MNRIRCAKCRDLLHSRYTHDFVVCSCGSVFVDGGDSYRRWGGAIEDIIIVNDDGSEKPMAECQKPAEDASQEGYGVLAQEHDEVEAPDNKGVTIDFFRLLVEASKSFLTEPIPENFRTIPIKDQQEFLAEHVWDSLKLEEGEIWDCIVSAAESMKTMLQKEGATVKGG